MQSTASIDNTQLYSSSPLSIPARIKILMHCYDDVKNEIKELKFKSPYVVPFSALHNIDSAKLPIRICIN